MEKDQWQVSCISVLGQSENSPNFSQQCSFSTGRQIHLKMTSATWSQG
jgi:hypothetical protein